MVGEQLRQRLMSYNPSEEEIGYKNIILDFLSTNENVFERSHCCGHITASSWLLSKDRSAALIMHHRKLDQWFQLGGHCDGNQDTLAVAVKESQEESGINDIVPLAEDIFDIDIHWIPSNKKEAGHYHYDIRYMLGVNSEEQVIQNSESKELRWISINGEYPGTNRSVNRMFEKWKKLYNK